MICLIIVQQNIIIKKGSIEILSKDYVLLCYFMDVYIGGSLKTLFNLGCSGSQGLHLLKMCCCLLWKADPFNIVVAEENSSFDSRP